LTFFQIGGDAMRPCTPQLPPGWPEWSTTRELAKRWRFSEDSILRWIRTGKLAGRKFPGGQYRVHRSVIEMFEGVSSEPRPKRRKGVRSDVPDLLGAAGI
jgi:excisionase family DNA binding protein